MDAPSRRRHLEGDGLKFIFNGSYTQYDGHEFMFGKPTDVTGSGTIEKLLKDERFTKCDDYNALKLTDGQRLWTGSRQAISFVSSDGAKLCPKCGAKPAKHFHVINCKGKE